jgi:SAM-dependent methyltransferase
MDLARQFWERQTSSRHRLDTDDFYKSKAQEHAAFLADAERTGGVVDIGCGAGELLYFFSEYARVDVAIDYSSSMLEQARARLAGKQMVFIEGDAFDHLPDVQQQVWTSTGAVNQYLAPDRVSDLLDMFCQNNRARTLYLFDCVDPIRIVLMPFGISYRQPAARASGLKELARRTYRAGKQGIFTTRLILGLQRPAQKLRGDGMGYGFLPRFWLGLAAQKGLKVEIVSSRYYEYRYHVMLRKPR